MLTSVAGNNDKVAFYIHSCKKMGIDVLPPDINESYTNFSVAGDKIRFGLAAVKNVGKGAIESIIKARKEKGPFKSFTEFCERINLSEVNKRAVESMIKCGAFDSLGLRRAQLLNVYERVMDSIANNRKRTIDGQMSLFGLQTSEVQESRDDFPDIKEFDKKVILAMEKEMLGLYISGHPLDEYRDELERFTNTRISDIIPQENEDASEMEYAVQDAQRVIIGGLIAEVNIKSTRNNDMMAFLRVEDILGSLEVIVFPKTYQKCSRLLNEDSAVIVKGRVSIREDEAPKIIAEDIEPLTKLTVEMKKVYLRLKEREWQKQIEELKPILLKHRGNNPVYVILEESKKKFGAPRELWVNVSNELIEEISDVIGASNVKTR